MVEFTFCICSKILRYTATHCNTFQHTAAHCNTLQHAATHCNTLQHATTHSNTLRHTPGDALTAIHCKPGLLRVDRPIEPHFCVVAWMGTLSFWGKKRWSTKYCGLEMMLSLVLLACFSLLHGQNKSTVIEVSGYEGSCHGLTRMRWLYSSDLVSPCALD